MSAIAGSTPARPSPPPLSGASRALLLALGLLIPAAGVGQLPPDARWRTLETPHFRIHFDPEVEAVARRAADRAERAHALLSQLFVEAPRGPIDLVVTDHVDASNGFAGVTPWKRIVVWASPPVDGSGLAFFDDWMELVVTHELAHIFHLDTAGRGSRALRAVLGRPPMVWPVFPNRGLPTWLIEGLAVYWESALTEAGRVRGTFHDMVVRTAALHGRLESLDQVGGDTPVWPGGQRPYVFGGEFFSWLAERHGPGSVGRFARAVGSQWIPYRLDAASRQAFGVPISRAYDEWREEVTAAAERLADSLGAVRPFTRGEPLTREARTAVHPAFGPDGTLGFARADGRSDAQLRLRDPHGGERGIRTNGVATWSWTPSGGLVISQMEAQGPWRLRRDLTVVSPDGDARPLTRGARLSWPHVHPAGGRAVAVQEGEGTNRLVIVDLESGEVEPLTPFLQEVHWAYPRWSPDGSWIAVSRWSPGARYHLLLLRPDGSPAHSITSDRAVDASPAWSPDGRWLLWSSDRTGIPNLFAVPVDAATGQPGPVRQVTHVVEGAAHPAVDPAGEWLVYARYGPTGWDLERIPFRPSEWRDPLPTDPRFLEGGDAAERRYGESTAAPHRPYAALPSALPRWWSPRITDAATVRGVEVVGTRVGVALEGRDLVDRHRWEAEAAVEPDGGRWDLAAGWVWSRPGNPIVAISARQDWGSAGSALGRRADGRVDTLYVAERERSAGASATLLRVRARSILSLTLSGRVIREVFTLQDAAGAPSREFRLSRPERDLREVRWAAGASSARAFAFSVGPERGASLSASFRQRRELGVPDSLRGVPGGDRGFDELTGAVRLYQGVGGPGYAAWVLAFRGAAGTGRGPAAGPFFFDVGGASGTAESITGFSLFGGRGLLFPVRGYPEGWRSGRHAWATSAELRFPLAVVHRGVGPALLHLDRLSGTLFLDAGNAWGSAPGLAFPNPRRDPLASAGGELIVTGSPFWFAPLDLRVGVAVPLVEGEGVGLHLRVGRSF